MERQLASGLSSLLAGLWLVGAAGFASAQPAVQLADLNTFEGFSSSSPSDFTLLPGGSVLFFASSPEAGRELWRASTAADGGAFLVKDIRPGPQSSVGFAGDEPLVALGAFAYFFADDGVTGRELWRSDGTPAGTGLVRDLHPDGGQQGDTLFVLGGSLYLGADDGDSGVELWRTDGTSSGTVLFADLHPGPASADPSFAVASGGRAYFAARSDAGAELWFTNGTAGGTRLVRDVNPGPGDGFSSDPRPVVINGTLYFAGNDGTSGWELWRTDGGAAGTTRVKDINVGGGPSIRSPSIENLGGKAVFVADDGASGDELWISDGTTAGTHLVADLEPGATNGVASFEPIAVNGNVYFTRQLGPVRTLWTSDGTALGTVPVGDGGLADPEWFFAAGGDLWFSVVEGQGRALWLTQGLTGARPFPAPVPFTIPPQGDPFDEVPPLLGGSIYLPGCDAKGCEPWRLSPGPNTTERLGDVAQSTADASPSLFPVFDSFLYFLATPDQAFAPQLWRTDGTGAGLELLTSLPGVSGPPITEIASLSGEVLLSANLPSTGRELYRLAPTDAGVELVADLRSGSSNPRELTPLGDKLFFVADAPSAGLFVYAASDGGVRQLAVPGSPSSLLEFSGQLGLVAGSGDAGRFVRTNGTDSGTVVNTTATVRSSLVPFAGALYFLGKPSSGSAPGLDLMRIPANFGSAQVVRTDVSASAAANPRELVAAGDRLYFVVGDATQDELWESDGTDLGTLLVTSAPKSPGIRQLTAFGRRAAFVAPGPSGPGTLFQFDPDAGTSPRPVAALRAVPGDAGYASLTAVGDALYFFANDGTRGFEPWRLHADGGFELVQDLAPLSASSGPGSFQRLGPRLFFPANDLRTGSELWWLDLTAPSIVAQIDGGLGDAGFYVTDVEVAFLVVDEETSPSLIDCGPFMLTTDTPGTDFDCTASSAGGQATTLVRVKRDATAPTLSCDALYLVEAASDAGASVPHPPVDAGDGSASAPLLQYSHAPGATFALGDHDAGVTAIDQAGNVTSCGFTVRVRDTLPPLFTACPTNQSATAASPNGTPVNYAVPPANDLVGPVSYGSTHPSPGPFSVGNTVVTLTATDGHGNATQCQFTVTITDTQPPQLTCPPSVVVDASSVEGAIVSFTAATATDNGDPTPAISYDRVSGSSFPVGTTVVTASARDESGNTATCPFSVTVQPLPADPSVVVDEPESYYGWGCSSAGRSSAPFAMALPVALALLFTGRRRRASGFALCLVVFSGTHALGAEPAKTKLVFTGLEAGKGVNEAELAGLNEYLQSTLQETGAYQVSGRAEVAALLGNERMRLLAGCDEEAECLTEVSGALNADRSLSGSVSRVGDTMVVSLVLMDLKTTKPLGRETRRVLSDGELEPLLDEVRPALFDLIRQDPLHQGKIFDAELEAKREPPQPEGLMVGVRADADVLGRTGAPALTAGYSGRRFGCALTVLVKTRPGVRLEGRVYPVRFSQLRPFLGVGSTAFAAGVGLRASAGAELRLGQWVAFGDVAFERFIGGDPARFQPNAGLASLGFGRLF